MATETPTNVTTSPRLRAGSGRRGLLLPAATLKQGSHALAAGLAGCALATVRTSVDMTIRFVQAVLLKPIVEVPSAHSEKIGCASLISSGEGQGPENQLAFDLAHCRAKRTMKCASGRYVKERTPSADLQPRASESGT